MIADRLHILIPTDFSDNAWSATFYALHLYADQDCTFYFLNSLSLSHANSRTYITTRYVDTLTEASTRNLEAFKARAVALNNPKHTFEVMATTEDITSAINDAVNIYKINMVVAGTKGATGVNKFFLGSNAVKIIQNLEGCAMLAIPKDYDFKVPKHIAFPTDFNRVYQPSELEALLRFSDLFAAHIYVVHINLQSELTVVQQTNMRALQNYLEGHEHTFHWMDKKGTKSDEINEFIEGFNIDVLAMVNYKHSFIENVMKEPVIKKIGYQPTVPFLVIPA